MMTLEQMNHVKLIDLVFTWHLLNENEEDAVYYVLLFELFIWSPVSRIVPKNVKRDLKKPN